MTTENTDSDKVIEEFFTELLKNQKPLPPEFQKVLDENFWDLIE